MPFDDKTYDGIFCHALIHLLDQKERAELIANCYRQLKDGGTMIFTAITKQSPTYGKGEIIGKDRFEQFGGVQLFFYDENSIAQEFEGYGLKEEEVVIDNFPLHFVQCQKASEDSSTA